MAQRKYATAQQGLDQANRFVGIGESLERDGRKPHSDVAKFQLQQTAQEKSFREAKLSMESARLDLAVMLFRDWHEYFGVVNDLGLASPGSSVFRGPGEAEARNPDLRVAISSVCAASLNVSIARQAYLPSVKLEIDYGIEASCVGLRCVEAINRAVGPAPTIGHFMTAVVTLPVWDWGVRKNKLQQSEIANRQNLKLSAARRAVGEKCSRRL